MSYFFFIPNYKAIKNYSNFAEKDYAESPELRLDSNQSTFDVTVIAETKDLATQDYTSLHSVFINNGGSQVLYCYKPMRYSTSFSMLPSTIDEFKIDSPAEIVGCIVFAPPRISDSTISYFVAHKAATKADRDAFVQSAESSHSTGRFLGQVTTFERDFVLPSTIMASKPQPISSNLSSQASPAQVPMLASPQNTTQTFTFFEKFRNLLITGSPDEKPLRYSDLPKPK